ncbi:MAG: 30S ribosomal protein S9, partial [Candidatus Collierbacteria bacterium GW2011_GWF1_42_50]
NMAQKLTKKSKVAVKPVKTTPVKKGVLVMPKEYFSAVGRRKTAIARVRIWPGKQELVINGKPLSVYFKGETIKKMIFSPFVVADVSGQYTGSIKVSGSGIMGQAEAIMHGIGRALMKARRFSYQRSSYERNQKVWSGWPCTCQETVSKTLKHFIYLQKPWCSGVFCMRNFFP